MTAMPLWVVGTTPRSVESPMVTYTFAPVSGCHMVSVTSPLPAAPPSFEFTGLAGLPLRSVCGS